MWVCVDWRNKYAKHIAENLVTTLIRLKWGWTGIDWIYQYNIARLVKRTKLENGEFQIYLDRKWWNKIIITRLCWKFLQACWKFKYRLRIIIAGFKTCQRQIIKYEETAVYIHPMSLWLSSTHLVHCLQLTLDEFGRTQHKRREKRRTKPGRSIL